MPLYVDPDYVLPDYVEGDDAPVVTRPSAGRRLLLTEPLPLRTTRMLGDYAVNDPLPEVFGDLSDAPFPLIRLSAKRYLAADHAMQLADVFTDRQITLAWQQALASDSEGNTWTEVRFEAPIPDETAVSATGIGKRHPDTGAAYENPADIAERIMRMAGRDDDFSLLRAQCSRLDLRVAGRLFADKAIKDHIDDVMRSVGAIWWPGGARLYPTTEDPIAVLDLNKSEVESLSVTASVSDTADTVRLAFDRSDASGKPLHYIELTASPALYGGVSVELEYPWLRTFANAETVGRAVTQRLAGQRYDVEFDSGNMALRPGIDVRLVAHPEWQVSDDDPVVTILHVELGRASVHVTGETMIGDRPNVTVTAHSIALPDTVQAGLDVSVRDGVATFTATDEDGRPIPGARVSLDGSDAKTTDAQGKVRFALKFGAEGKLHEVAFEAPGFSPVVIEVLL